MNVGRLLVVGALVLAAAACGGESAEESVARAIAADLRSEEAFAADISDEEARCVGDGIVADLGVDDARTLGRDGDATSDDDEPPAFAFESLTAGDVTAIGQAMETCVEGLDAIVVDLIATGILESPDDDFPVTDAEAQCVGTSVAESIPFGRLLAIGLEGDGAQDLGELSDDEAISFGTAFSACVDVRTILLDQVRDSGADAEVVACLDDQISDEAIELLFVDTFAGNEASAEGAFAEAIDACT
ncbi:hypothetical protein [Actinospongicola halichondriae]|uniref:hypothetical protein n=1 Tax=Actinospongicola halichondriae TaxID=3236844 RepID=UPI003D57BF9E